MTGLIAALDIGGTKTQLVIEEVGGMRLVDVTEASQEWEAEPPQQAADFIVARIRKHLPAGAR